MVVLTADNADEMIENLEAALKKVDEAHGSVVRLRRAENDVLKQVGNARDFLVAAFTDRDALQRVFAADITRTSRIHAVIDGLTLSEQTADDPRLQQCRDACSNIDRLLKELGYGDKLRDLQLSAKLKLSRRRSSCCIRSPDQTSAAIAAVMAGAQFKESLKREHVKKILACENCEDLAKLEPSKENNLGWWMIWMVHRLQLDDPSLTVLDFSNLQMPAGDHEQEVAPKLVKALANNHHIQELVMPNANLRAEEARILAETLPSNTSLKILNIDSNVLRPDDLALVIKGVGSNRSIEELRCNNQYLGDAGRSRGPALEALLEAVQANTNIVKLGMTITEAHYSNEINSSNVTSISIRPPIEAMAAAHSFAAMLMMLAILPATSLSIVTKIFQKDKVTPVEKVMELLINLRTKIEEEGKKEAAAYDKYACFCKEQADKKIHAIEESDKMIKYTGLRIDDIKDTIPTYTAEITELAKNASDFEDQLTKGRDARDVDHKAYLAAEKDLADAIDAATDAIKALKDSKEELKDAKLDFTQLKELTKPVLALLQGLPNHIKGVDIAVLEQLSQDPAKYEYHSNDIISLLQELRKTLLGRKQELDLTELEDQEVFFKERHEPEEPLEVRQERQGKA